MPPTTHPGQYLCLLVYRDCDFSGLFSMVTMVCLQVVNPYIYIYALCITPCGSTDWLLCHGSSFAGVFLIVNPASRLCGWPCREHQFSEIRQSWCLVCVCCACWNYFSSPSCLKHMFWVFLWLPLPGASVFRHVNFQTVPCRYAYAYPYSFLM